MAVRFVDGNMEYLDPMGGASSAGGALVYDDGTRNEPWQDRPGYGVNDMIASEALRWMATPADQIRMIRPPVPQQLFPPRFGYTHYPCTIDDIFNDALWRPQVRSWSWPPGQPTQRREFEEEMWSGSDRNVSMSVNPML